MAEMAMASLLVSSTFQIFPKSTPYPAFVSGSGMARQSGIWGRSGRKSKGGGAGRHGAAAGQGGADAVAAQRRGVDRATGSGSAGRIWPASDSSVRRTHYGRLCPIHPRRGRRCKHVWISFPARS